MSDSATPDGQRGRRWIWCCSGVWLAFVLVIIALADLGRLRPFLTFINAHPGSDKGGHFVLIGGVAFFFNLSLRCREWRGWLIGSVLVGTLATLEEISQLSIPLRTFDLLDLAADFAGICFFGWLAKRLSRPPRQV